MDEQFKIYVDRLKNGKVEDLNRLFSPAFLEIDESELTFPEDVAVSGEAYLADNELILHFSISTKACIPCSICNCEVLVPINIDQAYHAEPIENTKSGIFNMKDLMREMILLETPRFIECSGGKCPEREKVVKYLKSDEKEEDDSYQPFKDLDLN